MLCHTCHKEADSHNTNSPLSTEYRKKLRDIAYTMVKKSNHIDNQNDKDYNAPYKTNPA